MIHIALKSAQTTQRIRAHIMDKIGMEGNRMVIIRAFLVCTVQFYTKTAVVN